MKKWSNGGKFSSMGKLLGGKPAIRTAPVKLSPEYFLCLRLRSSRREIAIIILKSRDRDDDVIKILDYLKQ